MLSECWSDMLLRLDSPAEWIWHGLLAPRCVTLITADRSAQVNELLHFLVAHRHTGTPFLGRQLRPGKTAVVTSVSRNGWLRRAQQVPLGPNVCFLFDSQARFATPSDCAVAFDQLIALRHKHAVDLVVFEMRDRLASGRDTAAAEPDESPTLFKPLTDAGLAVLLAYDDRQADDHPSATPRPSESAPFATIQLCYRQARFPGRRLYGPRELIATSGYTATPPTLRCALKRDYTDIEILPERARRPASRHWPVLQEILGHEGQELTRKQIHTRWPADMPRPAPLTLWRWLDAAYLSRQVIRTGTGNPADPYRYRLPAGKVTVDPAITDCDFG